MPLERIGGLLEKALRELDDWNLDFVEREIGEIGGSVRCGVFSVDSMVIHLESRPGAATKVLVSLKGRALFYREGVRRDRVAELFAHVEKMNQV